MQSRELHGDIFVAISNLPHDFYIKRLKRLNLCSVTLRRLHAEGWSKMRECKMRKCENNDV